MFLTTVIQVKTVYDGAEEDGTPYNTRAYGARGWSPWTNFEEGAASLAAYHRMKSDATSRRHPKLIDVSEGGNPKPAEASQRPKIEDL